MAKREHEKARQLFRDIARKGLAHVYLFWGEERHLILEAVSRITKRVFPDSEPNPLRYHPFNGRDATGEDIATLARTFPFMGGTRLIVVEALDKMNPSCVQLLARYADNPAKHSILILIASKVDKRKKGWRELGRSAVAVAFDPLYDNQIPSWIIKQGKALQLVISREIAGYLTEAVGTDMTTLSTALEKLRLSAPANGVVGFAAVRNLVLATRDRGVFELTKALSTRDLRASLAALLQLLDQGEKPVGIGAVIASHTRTLLRLKAAQAENATRRELSAILGGGRAYFLPEYLNGTARFELGELVEIHQHVFQVDSALKGRSGLPPDIVLSNLVMKICPLTTS